MNNGYAYKSEITGVLKGLGFAEEDFSLHVNTLSGGQKTRVSLGKLLLSKPDIIMLDEPTNHLDMESISWLENYLLITMVRFLSLHTTDISLIKIGVSVHKSIKLIT